MNHETNKSSRLDVASSAALESGVVRMKETPWLWVDAYGSMVRARQAASCLVEPEINDKVLIYQGEAGNFILAVLVRHSESPARIPLENGLVIDNRKGPLVVETPEFEVRADKGQAEVETLSVSGAVLDSRWHSVREKMKFLETTAERWIQKLQRHYRTVEEFEESRLGRLRCMVSGLFYVKSETTAIQADKKVKLDGKKILLG